MKEKLDSLIKKYSNKVLPYIRYYDYFIKLNDQESALIILEECTKKAKPESIKEYSELVTLMHDNSINLDLQKQYIKEVYMRKSEDFRFIKKIEELYEKIIKPKNVS